MKTVKLMVEVELDGETPETARAAVKDLIGESYYTALAVEIYDPSQAERAAFLALDHAFITTSRPAVYKLQGTWDDLHRTLVRTMDPIESARALKRAKELLAEDIKNEP